MIEIHFYIQLLWLVALVGDVAISLLVYFRNPASASHRLFAIIGLVTFFWLITMVLPSVLISPYAQLLWIRLSMVFATFQAGSVFLLSVAFPHKEWVVNKNKLYAFLFISGIVALVVGSPYGFTHIVSESYTDLATTPVPSADWGMGLFGLYSIGSILGSIFVLWRKSKITFGVERVQIQYLFFAVLLMYGLIITTILIPTTIFENTSFVPFFSLYTLLFLLITSYSILKHRFFDVRIAFRRFFFWVMVTAFVLLLSILLTSISGPINFVDGRAVVLCIIYILFISLFLSVYEKNIRDMINVLFMGLSLEEGEVIEELNMNLIAKDNRKDIFETFFIHLKNTFGVDKQGIMVLSPNNKDNEYFSSWTGFDGQEVSKLEGENMVNYLNLLINTSVSSLVRSELKDSNGEIYKILDSTSVEIITLLSGEDEVIYFASAKKKGFAYSVEDIKILEKVIAHLALYLDKIAV